VFCSKFNPYIKQFYSTPLQLGLLESILTDI